MAYFFQGVPFFCLYLQTIPMTKNNKITLTKRQLQEMIYKEAKKLINEGDVVGLDAFRKEKEEREGYYNEVLVSVDGAMIFEPEKFVWISLNHRDQADALVDKDIALAEELGAKVFRIVPEKDGN